MTDVLSRLRELRIVPVIVIDNARDAAPLAGALVESGLPCAEITFRTAEARKAIERIAVAYPDFLVGAGTVLTTEQAEQARDAGARFLVAPGFNPDVVERCLELDVSVFPGVCTPTEIDAARRMGLTVLKFFPAEPMGGLRYLKAVAGPFSDVEFLPTGGLDLAKLPEYLAFERAVACGGSWMAPRDWIRDGAFDRIRLEAERAVAVVRKATEGR